MSDCPSPVVRSQEANHIVPVRRKSTLFCRTKGEYIPTGQLRLPSLDDSPSDQFRSILTDPALPFSPFPHVHHVPVIHLRTTSLGSTSAMESPVKPQLNSKRSDVTYGSINHFRQNKIITITTISIRQLLSKRHGGWQDYLARLMGYSRTRRLRSSPSSIVPTDGCFPHLLFTRQPA